MRPCVLKRKLTVTPMLILKTWLLILKINFREQNLALRIRSLVSRPKFWVKKYNELIVTISGARIKFIMEHTTFFHEVHTLSCFLLWWNKICTFKMHPHTKRQSNGQQNSLLILFFWNKNVKLLVVGHRQKIIFPKFNKLNLSPFLLPKNFNLLCLNCTCKHWQLAQTAVGVSGYCIIFLLKEINRFPRKTHAYNQNSAGLIDHPENKSSSSYITLIMSINAINFLIKEKDEKMRKCANEWIIDRQFVPQKTIINTIMRQSQKFKLDI